VREFQESTIARGVPPWFLDNAIAESLKLPGRVWHAAFAQMLELDPPPLSRIVAPTLILWGERDAITRRVDQDELMAGLRDARLVVYEGTGHAIHWEEPARFAADVAAFVCLTWGVRDAPPNPPALRGPAKPCRSATADSP
jgi:pimeloyl-ACP methyl ester carboxylesterase